MRLTLLSCLAALAVACTSNLVDRGTTPEPVAIVPGEALSHTVAPSDTPLVALVSVADGGIGAPASLTIAFGIFQTCHATLVYPNGYAAALATVQAGEGERPRWSWITPREAIPGGQVLLTCGPDVFAIALPAKGSAPVQAVLSPLTTLPQPWPTPLACGSSLNGCR